MAETANLYYPYTVYPEVGTYVRSTLNATVVEKSFTGIEQRLSAYPNPGYEHFQFTTIPLKPGTYATQPVIAGSTYTSSGDPAKDFLVFLKYMYGRFRAFYFIPYDTEYFLLAALGTMAGGESNTYIPFRMRDSDLATGFTTLKIAGITKVFGSDYTVSNDNPNTIQNANTRIHWVTSPGAGALTGTFFGAAQLIVRLDTDNPPRQIFAPATQPFYLQWQLSMMEVR
jgi:hypothetical protein